MQSPDSTQKTTSGKKKVTERGREGERKLENYIDTRAVKKDTKRKETHPKHASRGTDSRAMGELISKRVRHVLS